MPRTRAYSAQHAATEARHIDKLRNEIDPEKLCSRAAMLRDGIPCTVDLSRKSLSSMMGNQNCHDEIVFEDKVKWLARFRLARASSPPPEVRDWIFRSEAATMTYLQQHTRIPAPRIFDWVCESNPANQLGFGYVLMEKLDGKPLDWQAATPPQKEKVLQQLVGIFLEIEKHPFNAIGSLDQSTYRAGKGPLGPFSSLLEYSQAMLDAYLAMIGNGELDSCCPVDTYLVHRFRRENVRAFSEAIASETQLFLKHPDDKGDHILVSDSTEAFCSPCMMWPVDEFYNGINEIAAEEVRLDAIFREKSRDDLAGCVIEGRKVQRFFFALGPESSFVDTQTHQRLFGGLRRAFNMEDEELATWKSKALDRWKDDSLLLGLLEMEEAGM
ncbi:hypothetical protein BDW74DRAFT_171526 [Aspergillus multicolor]|uniref:uncharacterized protein n=1 Tax=Aspergillus multicolor TaxID=41759 RepID=UPI003CCDE585